MKIQEKPDYLIFADSAKKGEVNDFPDVSRGWGVTIEQTGSKPPMEWMNGAFNRIDKNMLYLLQQGISEWSESVIYPVNAIIKHKGVLYIALAENDNVDPSKNKSKWRQLQADDFNALPAQKKNSAGTPIYEVGRNISTGYRVGEQWLSAYRFNELPFGCYFRNGDNYLLDSPQGRVLNSFSNNYKRDHGITIKTLNGKQYINVPTAFAPDGRGYFERAVDGTTRQVGSVQPDAIRNIYGEILFHGNTADGSYPADAKGVFSGINKKNSFRYGQLSNEQISFGGFAFNAETFVPTGPENTVLNVGRAPVIYLGV